MKREKKRYFSIFCSPVVFEEYDKNEWIEESCETVKKEKNHKTKQTGWSSERTKKIDLLIASSRKTDPDEVNYMFWMLLNRVHKNGFNRIGIASMQIP